MAITAKGHAGATVTFDGERITIERKGFLARMSVGAGERTIPLAALSAVEWDEPTMLRNGSIKFVHDGRAAAGNIAQDPDGVIVTKQQARQFHELRDAVKAAIANRLVPAETAEHVTPPPTGHPIRPWSTGPFSELEAVGESYRPEAFARTFANVPGFDSERGTEIRPDAALALDPDNPHATGTAVSIWLEGSHVGFLSNADAAVWGPIVRDLRDQERFLVLRSRVWATRKPTGRINARVTLYMPDPTEITPANPVPDGPIVVLPYGPGKNIQVQREEDHLDVLAPYLTPKGAALAVTLHRVTEQRARSSVELIEVRLDGQRVGVLTSTSTANLAPLIEFTDNLGKIAVARARLSGTTTKAELVLSVEKAATIEQAWYDAVADHGN